MNCADCGNEAKTLWEFGPPPNSQLLCKVCWETWTGQSADVSKAKVRGGTVGGTHGNTVVEKGFQVRVGGTIILGEKIRAGKKRKKKTIVETVSRELAHAERLERRARARERRKKVREVLQHSGYTNRAHYERDQKRLALIPKDRVCMGATLMDGSIDGCGQAMPDAGRSWIVGPDGVARCVSCHRKKFPPARRRDARS